MVITTVIESLLYDRHCINYSFYKYYWNSYYIEDVVLSTGDRMAGKDKEHRFH